jgi:hypothetical protein
MHLKGECLKKVIVDDNKSTFEVAYSSAKAVKGRKEEY